MSLHETKVQIPAHIVALVAELDGYMHEAATVERSYDEVETGDPMYLYADTKAPSPVHRTRKAYQVGKVRKCIQNGNTTDIRKA